MSIRPPNTAETPPAAPRRYASTILAGTAVLMLLYLGRELLIPIALAAFLSLLIAPLVRGGKRIGLGQVPAVLAAVLALSLFLAAIGGAIVVQVLSLADSLPQYELTIRDKISVVREATVGRLESMQGQAGRILTQLASSELAGNPGAGARGKGAATLASRPANGAVPVEIQERPPQPVETMLRIFTSVWGPLGTAGVVLIVLIFVLLEHDSLRDRLIRLTGGTDVRATTHAFNDAGERLSRYFVSQFAVNFGVGATVWISLILLELPHAMLWGVLAAVLRFIPYIGFPLAALCATLLAAAVDPGWALLWQTLALFSVIELVAAQVIEPQLYGHSTGLSPLSVIVSAIFWGWLWGPVGLLLSTPLTLCMVVAGRHVQALAFLDILLGDTPALTLSQRFYQRALSGDAHEIIAAARTYVKRKSLARYCDNILVPALELGYADLVAGHINEEQQLKVREVIVQVIESLGGEKPARVRSKAGAASVLEAQSLGKDLRQRRQEASGQWQGPLEVPPGSVTLCLSMGTSGDELVAEILVRILRQSRVDARHLSAWELDGELPPGARHDSVAMVFIVCDAEDSKTPAAAQLAADLRRDLPGVFLIGLNLLGQSGAPSQQALKLGVDRCAHSFEEAVQFLSLHQPSKADTSVN